nr:uncharacterized protein LOC111985139 [Quercus suber]
MDEADQEKTSFITSQGLFCYKVMPFGLKNTGATYQRLVNHMFRPQIGRNVEVYVDDMLVKSLDEGSHLDDFQETFETLRRYKMKLNPSKCAFGVSSGKFLGFMVSERGIEANPDKIQAILDMEQPKNIKEVQSLTGRVAALNSGQLSLVSLMFGTDQGMQAQALADFIAEFTPSYEDLDAKEDSERWVVHVDGSSTLHTGGIGVVLQSPEGDKLKCKLVISQVNEMCEAKEDRMKKYLKKVLRLAKKFREANFVQIPREENMEADTLAKEASANETMDKFDEIRYMPSIDLPEMLQIEGEENWMTPIVSYLRDERLPEGKDEARKLRVRSARYILMDEVLYKRGFSQPYLRCLAPDEANYLLREVHEGACGNHSGARSLVHKVIRAGYYWPTIQADAKAYVKESPIFYDSKWSTEGKRPKTSKILGRKEISSKSFPLEKDKARKINEGMSV